MIFHRKGLGNNDIQGPALEDSGVSIQKNTRKKSISDNFKY